MVTNSLPRALRIGMTLNFAFVLVEAFVGWRSGSVGLFADAAHNLGDVIGLVLAWGAIRLGQLPPTARHTYGYRRATVLAALTNAILVVVAVLWIAWQAVGRLSHPVPVDGSVVALTALIGILVNAGTAFALRGAAAHDLNARGAFVHMVADAGVSAGVVSSGLLLRWTGWSPIDPLTALLVGMVILIGTAGLLRDSLRLALDGSPVEIDVPDVRRFLDEHDGVVGVHDLHVWALSTTETALTAHLQIGPRVDSFSLVATVTAALRVRFAISHVTLQAEPPAGLCKPTDPACGDQGE